MNPLTTGYYPDTDEYDVAGACAALGGISRATLDRWIPPETAGRRRLETPGSAGQVRIAADLVRAHVPLPAGADQKTEA